MKSQLLTIALTLVGFCAIDWYRPDGSLYSTGGFVYTRKQADTFAKRWLLDVPGFTYDIRCEE